MFILLTYSNTEVESALQKELNYNLPERKTIDNQRVEIVPKGSGHRTGRYNI